MLAGSRLRIPTQVVCAFNHYVILTFVMVYKMGVVFLYNPEDLRIIYKLFDL